MYRILLIDDEALIVDGLAEYISQKRPDRYEVLKAYSGSGAVGMIERMRIDILITDIEMTGMDGLEVHKRCLEKWSSCATIFLTAHANFEYAYQAIQDKRARFILKSEGFERLLDLLERTADEIDAALLNETRLQEAQRREDVYLQRYLVLRRILTGGLKEREELEEHFSALRMGFETQRPVTLLLLRAYTRDVRGSQLSLLSHYIRGRVGDTHACEGVQMGENELACILQSRDGAQDGGRLSGMLELWQETFEKLCASSVGVIVSERPAEWQEVDILLGRMRAALPRQEEAGSAFILYCPDEREMRRIERERMRRRLLRTLEAHADVRAVLTQIYAEMHWREAALVIVQSLNAYMEQFDELQSALWSKTIGSLLQTQSAEACAGVLEGFLGELQSEQSRAQRGRHAQVVESIERFIQMHYAEDISLSDIAAEVYLAPTYVSGLYKRMRGCNVMDTLTNVRMAQAKRLLSQTNKQIQHIAQEIGYHSARYFISSFRRHTGMSPNAYREANWQGDTEKQAAFSDAARPEEAHAAQ